MPRLPSRAELVSVLETELKNQADASGSIPPNLRPGSRNSVFISTVALGLMRLQTYVADRVGARLLSEAVGADLDDLGRDLFGEDRKPAVKATGQIWFVLDDEVNATSIIPRGTRVGVKATSNQPSITYEVTRDVVWTSGPDGLSILVPIAAQQEGIVGNIDASRITELNDPVQHWKLDASRNQAGIGSLIGGGADVESDDGYRRRLSQRSLEDDRQRGTRRAIEAGVGRVPGVFDWTVIEPGDGSIIVYAGDSNYVLTPDLRTKITTELQYWRPLGPPFYLYPYNAVTVTVAGTIHMQRGLENYNQADILTTATEAVKTYFATGRAAPDEYYLDAIKGAIFRSSREVQHVILTSPGADQLRPTSADYGSIQALDRYRVVDGSIAFTLSGPLTQ